MPVCRKPSQFHEPSVGTRQPAYFFQVARHCVATFAPEAPFNLNTAVAAEAVERVFGAPFSFRYRSQAERRLAVETRCHGAGLPPQVAAMHARKVRQTLCWEQHKDDWAVGMRCKRYAEEPGFHAWLETVPGSLLRTWRTWYLGPANPRNESSIRQGLARLVPMPRPIRKRFLTDTLEPQPPAYRAVPAVEHLVALASQRLVAFHTLHHSFDGPNGLKKLKGRCLTSKALHGWPAPNKSAADELAAQLASPLVVNSLVSQRRLVAAASDAEEIVDRVRQSKWTVEKLEEVISERPPVALLRREICSACQAIESSATIDASEQALPPFHATCRCYELEWYAWQMSSYERRLRMWALEQIFPLGDAWVRFPFDQFFQRCQLVWWSG